MLYRSYLISSRVLENEVEFEMNKDSKESTFAKIHKKIDDNKNRINNIVFFEKIGERLNNEIELLSTKTKENSQLHQQLMESVNFSRNFANSSVGGGGGGERY